VKRHEMPWKDIHEIYSPLPRHIQKDVEVTTKHMSFQ